MKKVRNVSLHNLNLKASHAKWLVLSALTIIADQLSKLWALDYLSQHQGQVKLFSWFYLTLVFNDGAAFSFLSGAGGWQRGFFIIFTLVVLAILTLWLLKRDTQLMQQCSLALIIGGALGNLIDRLRLGHVVDFIHWHYASWSWPIFNVADSAISLGVALIIIHALFFDSELESNLSGEEQS